MAQEIEAKFRVASHAAVRERLRALHAVHLAEIVEQNSIFDSEDGSLRTGGVGLRVRVEHMPEDGGAARATMTFKGRIDPRSDVKSREELEVVVSDADRVEDILARIGFVRILYFEKRRDRWRIDGCSVELDEPAGLGCFIEIEGPTPEEVHAVRDRLALKPDDYVGSSYAKMLLDLAEESGMDEASFSFS